MTQRERVLEYIRKHGSISSMEAFHELGVTRLASRISDLSRKEGYVFRRKYEKKKNRFGQPVHYMRYSLPDESEAGQ